MAIDINKKIEEINKGMQWIKQYYPEHYDKLFLQMAEQRRKLIRIADVEQDNPAIAAYGVSQVGKSYLMNCMLQKNGQPFMLEADGRTYNFIEEMNPKTDNTEATGVVTRFTSFSKNPERFSAKYPIMMRCLSVSDIVLVVCDGYYNDLLGFQTFGEEELKGMAEEIYNKYINMPENMTSPIQADDILDIQAYFSKHLKSQAQAILRSEFFQKLALVANRIASADWVDIFSILWFKTQYQTKLFRKMVETLGKFKYAKYVYLPPQALLHDGINENTVMSVQCLNQLFIEKPEYFTEVYLREGDNYTTVRDLTKSEVCAVCAEIIVKIGDDYLHNTSNYCFTDISPEVASQLTRGNIDMDILKDNDMLDFPGARSRKKLELGTMKEDSNLITVLLRGKVAYLFNMYNEAKRINILLYCHHQEKNEVSDIPLLLKDWIMNNIGRTMELRQRTMTMTGNISPLFYIGTKFNLDMRVQAEDIANNENAMKGRWQQRFHKTLYSECFQADATLDEEGEKIFLNWTRPGEHFYNSYVLRDYKFSGPKGNHLYENERTTPDTSVMVMKGSSDARGYYIRMRETFIQSEYVKCFFRNPALSWDVAASINNDGALFIIENLGKVAKTMRATREQLFNDVITSVVRVVYELLATYYVSNDVAEILANNINKANGIFRELDFACQENPDFFGHMLQDLQLTEAQSFKEIHRILPTLGQVVHSAKNIPDYERIRKRCGNFEGCQSEEDRWRRVIESYHFRNRDEAIDYFKRKNVNIDAIIKSEETIKRKNSAVIADDLIQLWQRNINGIEFMNLYSGDNKVDEISLSHLVDCISSTAKSVGLAQTLETSISPYVDLLNTNNINEELVADIIATTISDFVIDFGYRYLGDEQIATSRRVAKDERLACFDWIDREHKEHYEEDEITAMFDDILSSTELFTPAYEANYNSWLEYMYIAFIAHINVPDFNREANESLEKILVSLK